MKGMVKGIPYGMDPRMRNPWPPFDAKGMKGPPIMMAPPGKMGAFVPNMNMPPHIMKPEKEEEDYRRVQRASTGDSKARSYVGARYVSPISFYSPSPCLFFPLSSFLSFIFLSNLSTPPLSFGFVPQCPILAHTAKTKLYFFTDSSQLVSLSRVILSLFQRVSCGLSGTITRKILRAFN